MDVSQVLIDAWALYKRFFGRFVATAAVVYVVLDLVGAIVASSAEDALGTVLWSLVGLVLSIVGFFWVQGAVVEAVRDVRDGRADVPIGELYARTRPRLPALISAGVLAAIGIALGFVLLIVPGLYLLTRWAVIVPVIVLERSRAGASFSRSAELVKGNGWSVLGLVLLTLIGAGIAQNVIAALFTWLPRFFAAWIGGLVAHSLVIPFAAITVTLAYYRLVGRSPESEALAAASS